MNDSAVRHKNRAQPLERLWYTRCPVPTATSIAIELGWLDHEFASDQIVVSSLGSSQDRDVRASHFDHRLPNSFREGGNAPALWSRSRGQDTRLLGATWVDQYQAVVALPDAEIESASDLCGRRLGVAARINDPMDFWQAKALRGLLTALALGGLGKDDAEIVVLREPATSIAADTTSPIGTLWAPERQQGQARAEAFALIRGEVDAIYLSGGLGCAIEALLGARRVVDLGAHPDSAMRITNSTPTLLTATGALVREQRDVVRRYVECLIRAAGWASDHHEEARRIIAAELGEAEVWVERAYGEALYANLRPTLNDELLAAVTSQKSWLLAHGFIRADFDVSEWAAPEVLNEIGQ